MINIFDYLFNRPNSRDHIEENTMDNIITFSIDQNNEVTLKMQINDDSIKASNRLALFLFMLNSGLYAKQMVETILSMSKNKEDDKFIENIIDVWHSYLNMTPSIADNQPLVSPCNFSKQIKNHL